MATVKGSDTGEGVVRHRKELWFGEGRCPPSVTIETLPDDVLLGIFDFYVNDTDRIEEWHTLVHVCRRWRYVVFASPRRLRLGICCTERTPVREMLDVWPALPIRVWNSFNQTSLVEGADNIVAALKHNHRVDRIVLHNIQGQILERFVAVMQEPFPMLTSLLLFPHGESTAVLPDSFLCGSAPRLQSLSLSMVTFPALPKLLSSANDLVYLRLWDIPDYILPEAVVTCLSTMSTLDTFHLGFSSLLDSPVRSGRRLLPLTRVVLPALTSLRFQGSSEYLEDVVAQIDAPLLDLVELTLSDQPNFDVSQLLKFIERAENLKVLDKADILFHCDSVEVSLSSRTEENYRTRFELTIALENDWQISPLLRVCSTSSPPLSTVERLDISDDWGSDFSDTMANAAWLEVLRPFTAVRDLYLSEEVALCIVQIPQETAGERGAEMLPALQSLFIEGLEPSGTFQEVIGLFVAARKRFGHPVVVHRWEIDEESDSDSDSTSDYYYYFESDLGTAPSTPAT